MGARPEGGRINKFITFSADKTDIVKGF